MITNPSLIFLFAVSFTVFIVLPAFLGQPLPQYPLIHFADVFDILTPLALIPLYWLLFTDAGRVPRTLTLAIMFLVLSTIWVEGQGMHLSANSIGNLLGSGSRDIHTIVHFYDEVLSHYLWHAGIIGLSMLLTVVPPEPTAHAAPIGWRIVLPSAVLYGITFFLAINEGGTVPLGFPIAILLPIALMALKRRQLRSHNLVAFFFVGYVVAALFFLGWFAYWGGFPEFSEVGII